MYIDGSSKKKTNGSSDHLVNEVEEQSKITSKVGKGQPRVSTSGSAEGHANNPKILWNFEPTKGDASLLESPTHLREGEGQGQAKELKVVEVLPSGEKLNQCEINLGPFVHKDIVERVKQDLTPEEIKNFLSINTSFRSLGKPTDRVILTSDDLLPSSVKLQFARENNLKLNIELQTDDDAEMMIALMNDEDNKPLLANLEVIVLPDLSRGYISQLLGLLPNCCPNLTSFSCGDIENSLVLPDCRNLTSFSCGCVRQPLTLTNCPNLTFISFGDIILHKNDTIILPKELPNLQEINWEYISSHHLDIKSSFENLLTQVQKNFRMLAKPIILTGRDLLPSSVKLQFARENNLKLNIKLQTPAGSQTNNIKVMIDFINNPYNNHLLDNLKAIVLPDINDLNIDQIDILLGLLANLCSNLTSFSCKHVSSPLMLSNFINLTSFSTEDIHKPLTFTNCPNLISFSCSNIKQAVTFINCPNLTSFSCRYIENSLVLTDCPNLTSFLSSGIEEPVTFTNCPNLISFSCGYIENSLVLTNCPNLTSFSCGEIQYSLVLTDCPNLTSISLENITLNTNQTIIFPKELPYLKEIEWGEINPPHPDIKASLETLKAQIEARKSLKPKYGEEGGS